MLKFLSSKGSLDWTCRILLPVFRRSSEYVSALMHDCNIAQAKLQWKLAVLDRLLRKSNISCHLMLLAVVHFCELFSDNHRRSQGSKVSRGYCD